MKDDYDDIKARLLQHRISEIQNAEVVSAEFVRLHRNGDRPASNLQRIERRLLLRRWNDLSMAAVKAAKTVAEISAAVKECPAESETLKLGQEKWNILSMREIEAATTFEECWSTFESTDEESDAEYHAIVKCTHLSSTIEEATRVFEATYISHEVEQLILVKLDELLPQLDAELEPDA